MRRGLSVALTIALVVLAGGATLFYLKVGNVGSTSTITAPTFPGYHAIAVDSNSKVGIDLSLALNSTTIGPGQDLQSVVEVSNELGRVNNVSVSNDFPVTPLHPKCIPGDYTPFVIQMYAGNYGRDNITQATPLPYFLSCPAIADDSIMTEYYYLFQPDSANATLFGRTFAGNPGNTGIMSLRFVNQISIHQYSSSSPNGVLPDGVYTLMLEDWWGQMVILHFIFKS
jgi:hypothetical protein